MTKICKKSLALLLALAVCVSAMVCGVIVSAEEATPTITLVADKADPVPGDTVTITAQVANFSAVFGADIEITLPAGLTVTRDESVAIGEEDEIYYNAEKNTLTYVGLGSGLEMADGVVVSYNPVGGKAEGDLFAFTFTVPEDAAEGTKYTFEFSATDPQYKSVRYSDAEENEIVPTTTGITVVVASAHTHTWNYEYALVDGNCVTTKVCECGESEVVSSLANLKFNHAPVYESRLTLIFRMPSTSIEYFNGFTDVEAVVTKDMYDSNGDLTDPIVTVLPAELHSSGRTQFVYNGVRSMDMSSNLNCQVFGTNAEGVKVLIAVEDYSFRTYIETAYNVYKDAQAGTKNAAERQLVVDIAYYGAAAQIHFGYNTANLANANIPDTYATPTINDFDFDGNLIQSGVAFGRAPVYRDQILLNIRFVKTAVTEGAYLTVDYEATNGDALQYRVEAANFEQDPTRTDRYQVVFDKLTAAAIPSTFTITLYDASDSVIGSCVYGMEIYAYQLTNSTSSSITANEKTMVNRAVAYGRSAKAYFNFGK